ncbi:SPBc2 prophage-derived uncharacterized protein YopZ [Bienertia sinuspersici]
MSYRSKRTISTLSTDASKRPKPTPPLVSQSFTAANAINSPPPHTEANDCRESKELIKPIPPKDTHTSSQMPSFLSKAPTKWGPFCPPGNGVPTTLSPSFGTDGVTKMNSIWKTHPGTFNQIPQVSKPLGSSVGDAKQSSINQSSMKTKSATSKSKMGMSDQNIDGNQMHIGSSTTTFSRDTYDKKVVKPPDNMQQERIRLTTQLHHQKQEGGGQAAYMQQEGSRRTTYMQQQGSEQTRDKSNSSKSFKTRLPFKIDGWPTDVEYDAKEEVLTVDANGKLQFVSGSIQPIDILSNNGVKYYVEFNEFHQPIRKGGHILDDAKAKVESLKLANFCSSVDVEDEAFHDLMNGGDIPERPQGFGFGVKKSDVYGVRGLLRKEGSKKVKTRCVDFDVNVKKNEVLEKENRELSRKNDEYTKTLKAVVTQFSQILDVVRSGKASVQLIDAVQSPLHMDIPEVKDDTSSGDGATTKIEDAPTKSRD